MNCFRSLLGACLLGLAVAAVTAAGQALEPAKPEPDSQAVDLTPGNLPRQRIGRIIPAHQAPLNLSPSVDVRPVRPERDPLPPLVEDRVKSFDLYRNEYIKQQEQILKRTKGTTDRDRKMLRERLNRELRERWLEQSAAMREELRERRKALQDRLPSHRELLENAREQSRDALRDQRERRGLDK
jgi:hypothetical protein